jgi:hypothetical protein
MADCYRCGMHKSSAGPCHGCGARLNRLSDLEFDEISFVRSGANQDAHIVLAKSDAPPAVPLWQRSEGLAALARTYRDDWEPSEAVAKEDAGPMDMGTAGIETAYDFAESFAEVIAKHADLYDDAIRNHAVQFGKAASPPVEVQKGLDGLAASMVEQEQAATREQAIAKTFDRDPRMYDAMYVPDPGPVELVKHDVNPVRGQDIGPQWVFKDDIAAAEQREDARKEWS